ncbi:MAG: hypothetical protein PHD61_09315 [Bacteroidales bacterium]|nr:hypothetical protein [Lentimicrobiaceae bacterium]MDD5695484.1 hypothetical protein [Bacteroidales bacterium]
MYRKLLKFIIILFFSFSMYGFSRPAAEEDETARWRQREGIELTLDYVPVSAFVYSALSHDKTITGLYGKPEIEDYHDSYGDGYACHLQLRTRGGGRIALNFIWENPYPDYRVPERTWELV